MSTRAKVRRPLSPASVLSVAEAVVELGGRAVDARAWLDARGLVKAGPGGRRVVVWGRVLDALEEDEQRPAPVAVVPQPAGRLPRKKL